MNHLEHALRIARHTDTGQLRTRNEDAIASDASIGLAVLADGMGGYNAGDVASQMAVLTITAELISGFNQARQTGKQVDSNTAANLMQSAVNSANNAIYQVANEQEQCAGMGTTLVLSLFVDNQVVIGHIGDSRAYLLRNDQLLQLTNDHSLLQEQIDSGLLTPEQAKQATYKNFVTKALGVDPEADLEINTHTVAIGDLYLLCSDGLTDMVDDYEIETTLIEHYDDLESLANALIRKANQRGGKDNISVILISVVEGFPINRPNWLQSLVKKVMDKG
ncbi:MAG: Stp1/IreP family PP2C-type Ser/Thr phosphatase [Methylophilus sp.]|nr:Stp1/IreP family PP2C-type Ser/Thr phosphatase [Methylophilus sp.]MDP3610119.1 Stp1/IreP family PP2C-type Ser/Thr phosphatase [Methylophilus sp.]